MEPDRKGWIEYKPTAVSRRRFIELLALGGLIPSIGLGLLASGRSMVPGVLYEPPTKFKVGKPEDFPPGTVTFVKERKVYIQRDQAGLFAMSAVCTHLGCTVNWTEMNNDFECPCHGGKYRRDGVNYAGPPPRPLDRFEVQLDPLGRVVVDSGKLVSKEFRLGA